MKTVVRKSYVVMHNSMRFTEEMEIPSDLLPIVKKNQGWKLEVKDDGKEKGKNSSDTRIGNGEESEEQVKGQEEEKEEEINLSDFKKDKMVHEQKVRKRG